MVVGLSIFGGKLVVRLEDNESRTEELIDRLFPGNPLLCCGKSNSRFYNALPRGVARTTQRTFTDRAVTDDGAARINARRQTLSARIVDHRTTPVSRGGI